MIERGFWIRKMEEGWKKAPIVWLSGVKGIGKTTLARGLGTDRIFYVDCDPARSEHIAADPELFFRACDRSTIVFDGIHRLPDAMKVLRTGADLFDHLRIAAISPGAAADGGAGDILGDRKHSIHLGPILFDEIAAFGACLEKRLHRGGFPEVLLADGAPAGFYREWMNDFFERDIRGPFAIRDAGRFNILFEYLLNQSGEFFEISRTSEILGISRPTVAQHVGALEAVRAVTVVRPFHGRGQKEIVKMPRVYGLDTGFVAFAKGWDSLDPDAQGLLWEHVVLEYLEAHLQGSEVCYWRWADDRNVDFVIPGEKGGVDAIECEWDPEEFDPAGLKLFRSRYPEGRNYVLSPRSKPGWEKHVAGLDVNVCDPAEWREKRNSLPGE